MVKIYKIIHSKLKRREENLSDLEYTIAQLTRGKNYTKNSKLNLVFEKNRNTSIDVDKLVDL